MLSTNKKAPTGLTHQVEAINLKTQIKHNKKVSKLQGLGCFAAGFIACMVVGVLKQRTGTVGGEILLLPMLIGLAYLAFDVGRDF